MMIGLPNTRKPTHPRPSNQTLLSILSKSIIRQPKRTSCHFLVTPSMQIIIRKSIVFSTVYSWKIGWDLSLTTQMQLITHKSI